MRLREAAGAPGWVSMMLIAVVLSAPLSIAQSDNNPDVMEVRHYQLTMDKAQKAANALQSINQLVAANPSLNAALDAGSDSTSKKPITQQAQDIDTKYPQVAAIINYLGWVGMKKQGMIKAYPAGMITPENAALIEAN